MDWWLNDILLPTIFRVENLWELKKIRCRVSDNPCSSHTSPLHTRDRQPDHTHAMSVACLTFTKYTSCFANVKTWLPLPVGKKQAPNELKNIGARVLVQVKILWNFGGKKFYAIVSVVRQKTQTYTIRRASTHYPPAMPFGNRKQYFRGSFKFSIVTIQRISPIGILGSQQFRYFSKIKISYLGKILPIYLKLINHSKYFGRSSVKIQRIF